LLLQDSAVSIFRSNSLIFNKILYLRY